nr:MAG TPA: hypothetical protein [Caudoviricetes sp.]
MYWRKRKAPFWALSGRRCADDPAELHQGKRKAARGGRLLRCC